MGKNTAIKQQTNQNKLIGMKEFLQSLFEEAWRKKRKCWLWYSNKQANNEINVHFARCFGKLNHSINVIRDCHRSRFEEYDSFI